MHIRPLPYRRRRVTKQQAILAAGPSLIVFFALVVPWIAGR